MRCDFNAVLRGFDGFPIEQPVHKVDASGVHVANERGELMFERFDPVLLKKPLFDLLGGRLRGDESITGTQLLGRYQLAQKIAAAGAGPTELGPEDVKTLMDLLERGATPLVYGAVRQALDNPVPEET